MTTYLVSPYIIIFEQSNIISVCVKANIDLARSWMVDCVINTARSILAHEQFVVCTLRHIYHVKLWFQITTLLLKLYETKHWNTIFRILCQPWDWHQQQVVGVDIGWLRRHHMKSNKPVHEIHSRFCTTSLFFVTQRALGLTSHLTSECIPVTDLPVCLCARPSIIIMIIISIL
jgi:hypothetical protein